MIIRREKCKPRGIIRRNKCSEERKSVRNQSLTQIELLPIVFEDCFLLFYVENEDTFVYRFLQEMDDGPHFIHYPQQASSSASASAVRRRQEARW